MSNYIDGAKLLVLGNEIEKEILGSTIVTAQVSKGSVPIIRMVRIKDIEHPTRIPLTKDYEPWRVDTGDWSKESDVGLLIRKADPSKLEQEFWFTAGDVFEYNVKFTIMPDRRLSIMNCLRVDIQDRRQECQIDSTLYFYPHSKDDIVFVFIFKDKEQPEIRIYTEKKDKDGNPTELGDLLCSTRI